MLRHTTNFRLTPCVSSPYMLLRSLCRYDSKSLKLAPEASHTAPVVPTPEVLKPREDGGGDTEGEEVMAPRGDWLWVTTVECTWCKVLPPGLARHNGQHCLFKLML